MRITTARSQRRKSREGRNDDGGRRKFPDFSILHSSLRLDHRVTIDWTEHESARGKIKVLVKRIEIRSLPALAHCLPRSFTFYVARPARSILRKHGYPPDLQEEATKTVLAQAELLCAEWAA